MRRDVIAAALIALSFLAAMAAFVTALSTRSRAVAALDTLSKLPRKDAPPVSPDAQIEGLEAAVRRLEDALRDQTKTLNAVASGTGSSRVSALEALTRSVGRIETLLQGQTAVTATPTVTQPTPGGDATQNVDQLLQHLQAAVQNQTIILRVLAGGLQADEIPPMLDKLAQLEEQLRDPNLWPRTPDQATTFNKELQNLTSRLPTFFQIALAPRLEPLRWSAEAFPLLAVNATTSTNTSEAPQTADQLALLLEVTPPSIPADLIQELKTKHKVIVDQVNIFRRDDAIRRAEAALKTGEDVAGVWEELRQMKEDPSRQGASAEIQSLLKQLRTKVITDRCDTFTKQLDHLNDIHDPMLYQFGVSRIHQALIEFSLDLATENNSAQADPGALAAVTCVLERARAALEKSVQNQQKRSAGALRQYQRWALHQVISFNRWYYETSITNIQTHFASFQKPRGDVDWFMLWEFPEVRKFLAEKTGVPIPTSILVPARQKAIYKSEYKALGRWEHDDALAYRVTREAMVKCLAPIEESLLDPPVRRLFDKAFQKGWGKLEEIPDGKDQLYVAEQAAIVAKKTPHDIAIAQRKVSSYDKWAAKHISAFANAFDSRTSTATSLYNSKAGDRAAQSVLQEYPGIGDLLVAVGPPQVGFSVLLYDHMHKASEEDFVREAAFKIVRDALVQELLPIDVSKLSKRDAAIYRSEWCRGWNELAGREDQKYVGKQLATVSKATLQDLKNKEMP